MNCTSTVIDITKKTYLEIMPHYFLGILIFLIMRKPILVPLGDGNELTGTWVSHHTRPVMTNQVTQDLVHLSMVSDPNKGGIKLGLANT